MALSRGRLKPSSGRLGAILGHLGAVFGPYWAIVGPSYALLGAILRPSRPYVHRLIFEGTVNAQVSYDVGPMPLLDLSQWHALLLSAALLWAGVPPALRVQAPAEVTDAFE